MFFFKIKKWFCFVLGSFLFNLLEKVPIYSSFSGTGWLETYWLLVRNKIWLCWPTFLMIMLGARNLSPDMYVTTNILSDIAVASCGCQVIDRKQYECKGLSDRSTAPLLGQRPGLGAILKSAVGAFQSIRNIRYKDSKFWHLHRCWLQATASRGNVSLEDWH